MRQDHVNRVIGSIHSAGIGTAVATPPIMITAI
jgi:hypothetical protein